MPTASQTENAHDGPCHNPHDLSAHRPAAPRAAAGPRSPAGSSPSSLGSDTNGSIRVPASPVRHLRPEAHLWPARRTGTYPFVATSTIWPVCPQTATWPRLGTRSGPGPGDPAQWHWPLEPRHADYSSGCRWAADRGRRRPFRPQRPARGVRCRGDRRRCAWASSGASRCPRRRGARAAAFIITASEGANLHLPDLMDAAAGFRPGHARPLARRQPIPATWLIQAQRFRPWYRARVQELFPRSM